MKILIDNGHGVNTPGKCSSDGVFREYKYTREIAAAVVQHLGYRGFDAALVTPEEYDVSLRARTERVNTWCRQLGKKNVCLVSIHTNASGGGKQWMNARGWTCYTSRARRQVTIWPIASTAPLHSGYRVTSSGRTTPTEIQTGRATSSS